MKGLGTLVLVLLLGVMMPDAAAGKGVPPAAGKGVLPAARKASPKAKPSTPTASCNPFKERCDVRLVSGKEIRKMALSKKRYDVLPIPANVARKILRQEGGRNLAAHLRGGWAGPRLQRFMKSRNTQRQNRSARLRQARRQARLLNDMDRMIRRQNGRPGLRIDRIHINKVERLRFN